MFARRKRPFGLPPPPLSPKKPAGSVGRELWKTPLIWLFLCFLAAIVYAFVGQIQTLALGVAGSVLAAMVVALATSPMNRARQRSIAILCVFCTVGVIGRDIFFGSRPDTATEPDRAPVIGYAKGESPPEIPSSIGTLNSPGDIRADLEHADTLRQLKRLDDALALC